MKKTFIIILISLIILLAIVGYYVINIRKMATLVQKHNTFYEEYLNKEIEGTKLISIINKAVDENENNVVKKNKETNYYEDNGENSIHITVKFLEREEIAYMEDIAQKQSETFVKFFANAKFKCTKIEYHSSTNYVKRLYFEQTTI